MKVSESSIPASSMAPPQRRAQMSLRTVTPNIPENPLELVELIEDLRRMRCIGLLERPWTLKREEIVRKLVQPECPNIFDGTIRDRPQMWTADLWREGYEFPSDRVGLANRMGYPGDVVTKARLYDESMKKPEVVPAPKVLRALIDFSGKVEKLLGELRTLLQYGEQRKEAGSSKRGPESEPVLVPRPEPVP